MLTYQEQLQLQTNVGLQIISKGIKEMHDTITISRTLKD